MPDKISTVFLRSVWNISIQYSFRDDTLIMAFVKNDLGVTVSQELVIKAFPGDGIVVKPLIPECYRTIGLAFSKSANTVTLKILLEYLEKHLANI